MTNPAIKPKEMSLRRKYQVDILIRGWGNLPLTRRLVKSILDNTPSPAYQITYVDNGSPAYDFAQFVNDYPDIVAIRLPFNMGSVRGINVGLMLSYMSPADYVLLMDNDTEVPKGDKTWLERFISYFENDEQLGAAGAVTNYVAGYQNVEWVVDRYMKFWKTDMEEGIADPIEMPILVSFAMMIRKKVIMQLGSFDERYEPGMCEDYDYIIRMREKGWRAITAENVWIHHKGSQTFKNFDFNVLLNKNKDRLIEKWGIEKLGEMGLEVSVQA